MERNKMRIIFVVPRSYNPKQMYREYPLGVGFLGTLLKEHGHEVRIFDQNIEGEDQALYDLVEAFAPQVAGFSVITPNYPVAKLQLRHLKQTFPQLRLLAGGLHASLFPEDLIEDGADAIMLGEAEEIIGPLIDSLAENGDLSQFNGLVFKDDAEQSTAMRLRRTRWIRTIFLL